MSTTIFYICNRERCGNKCSYPMCKRTTDISYAKELNLKFKLDYADNKDMVFIQDDNKENTTKAMVENWKKYQPSKEIVREWRKLNPEGKKINCHYDTKLSRPTIDRYWNLVLEEESEDKE